MSTVLELDDIGKEIIDLMSEVLNAKQIEMYVIDEDKRSIFKSNAKEFLQESDFPVSEILSYSFSDKVKDRIAVIQELKYLQMSSENNEIQKEEVLSLIRYMDKYGIEVIVPISLRGGYLAFIILSDKRGGEMYTADDLRFISKIKNDIKVLLERSLLYEEVQEFNSMLQQKVDEQTKELQIKVGELEEARRKENDMIDIMGHELRTPATVVKLNTEMLRKYIDSNPKEYAKYLERISKAIDTEIGLINTLLTSAKLEGDKVEIRREKVNIKECIEMSVHGNEKELKKGVKIYTDIEKGLPFAYADKIRVMEVLDNLISNAVKYTDKGRIDIQARSKGENIEISVRDTGKGIPKEDISKLGSKFYRANNYLGSKIVRSGGTGLGLYVTFRLVKLMEGKINVESEEGKGSTFTFTLPSYTNQKLDSTDTQDRFTKLGLK
jgi:signal transduction histidine kinase